MRALVTGATGFVGSAVRRALVAAGWQVRALVRAGSDHRNLQNLPVDMVAGDLADGASLDRALADCQALFISLRTTASGRSSRSSCIGPTWMEPAVSSMPPAGRSLARRLYEQCRHDRLA